MRFGSIAAALVVATFASPVLAQTAADPQQPAQGQPQDPAQRFQAYVTSDGYKSMVGQLSLMGDTVSAPDCKDHKPKERAALTVYGPPLFEAGLHPVAGLWVDRIKMNRCGATTFQNVLIQAQKDGQPPRAALLLPGTTMANPPMQNLIMKDVLDALAKNKCADQTQIIPVDTKREKEIKPIKLDQKGMIVEGSWKETWTFKACGKTVNANVDINTDGKGGLVHKVKL
ncbi:MAG TPA: hypothetical protein VK196_17500 [Magnetospirillum sp.]|nr:hypothetical protein [Magnetospirillum sp.]